MPLKRKPKPKSRRVRVKSPTVAESLLQEVRELILAAQEGMAQTVNAGLTLLYWDIGVRIRRDILKDKRAEYGEQILTALSAQLEVEFGRGFGQRNLARMIKFAEAFPDGEILSALRSKLGWTHFRHIIYLDDPLKRDFCAEMCRVENWSTRMLEQKIEGMHLRNVVCQTRRTINLCNRMCIKNLPFRHFDLDKTIKICSFRMTKRNQVKKSLDK